MSEQPSNLLDKPQITLMGCQAIQGCDRQHLCERYHLYLQSTAYKGWSAYHSCITKDFRYFVPLN